TAFEHHRDHRHERYRFENPSGGCTRRGIETIYGRAWRSKRHRNELAETMKQLFSVLVILCWLTPPLQSRPRPQGQGDGGMLESYKIGWLTRRLALTTEEAQRFWPIYGLYTKEVRQAYQVYRNDKNRIELEESLLNIKKKYSVEFVKAIPP